jgi:O-antigen/teichoic acid export membrane protein
VQRPKLDDLELNTAFWSSIAVSLAVFGLCVGCSGPFADLFDAPKLGPVVMVTGLSLLFSGFSCVPTAYLRRHNGFKILAVRSLTGRLAGAGTGIAMAFAGSGVWSVILQQVVQAALAAVLIWTAMDWRPSLTFSLRRLRGLLTFVLPAVTSRVMWVLALRLFTIVYGYFFGIAASGYLNIAQRVVDTLYDTLGGAAYNTALPFFARSHGNMRAFFRTCRVALEFTAVSALPIFTGLGICAPSIVAVFLGEEWRPAAAFIRVFAIGAMFQFLFLLPNVALVAAGRPGAVLTLATVSFVFVFGTLLIVHPADPFGAVVIWGSRVVATAPLVAFYMYRLFNERAKALFNGSLVPLLAVGIMAFVLTFVQEHALKGSSDLVVLTVLVPFGVVIYVVFIALINRNLTARIIEMTMVGLRGLRATS